jgi:carbon storage regulator
MLVVSRKSGESILIGENIEIYMLEIGEGSVKVGINAPKSIKILRKELIVEIKNENIESINNLDGIIKKLKK